MLTWISVLVFCLAFLLLYTVLKMLFSNLFVIQKRLDRVMDATVVAPEEKSFYQAFLARREEKQRLKRLSSKGVQQPNRTQKQLEESGLIRQYSAVQWSLLKNMMSFIVGAGSFFVTVIAHKEPSVIFLMVVSGLIAVQILFRFFMISSISKRKQAILRSLPYTLDLVTVSVEAGLSFDGAIAKVLDNTDNVLTFEFSRALKEMRMGIERKKALRALSDRCNVKELTTVINALIQADELGVSIGKVLRIQAEQVREFRKQAAREKSMKAPVKMLFPLIFFIFPTVFVVVLGPAVIQIMDFFK